MSITVHRPEYFNKWKWSKFQKTKEQLNLETMMKGSAKYFQNLKWKNPSTLLYLKQIAWKKPLKNNIYFSYTIHQNRPTVLSIVLQWFPYYVWLMVV